MDSLKSVKASYEKWVANNPHMVSELETSVKLLSYIVAAPFPNLSSEYLLEGIYMLSNMLTLYNNHIIGKQMSRSLGVVGRSDKYYSLKVALAALEFCEVFVEVTGKRVYGHKGKWLSIALLQMLKGTGRFYLLKYSTESIITSPIIPAVNCSAYMKGPTSQHGIDMDTTLSSANFTLQLKRSGRNIRKVEGAPSFHIRDSRLMEEVNKCKKSARPPPVVWAEYLYVMKPLIHLAAMGVFGERKWKPYFVSLLMDVLSLHFYYMHRHLLTKQQKLELSRRILNLAIYSMRPPFFERYTDQRLYWCLDVMLPAIPFVKYIVNPLSKYLRFWQSTYSHLWST